MAVAVKRTNIYLSAEDRADAEYIKENIGLRSISSAVRLAVRRESRRLRAEEVDRRQASREDAPS